MYKLEIAKEIFKFSASHFALFGPYCGEKMHGHNYYVKFLISADSVDQKLGMAAEFNDIKPIFLKSCKELDELILIPEKSSYLNISHNKTNTEVVFNNKFYSFPKEDVKLLPLVNISVEELALHIFNQCKAPLKAYKNLVALGVEIEETRGQKCLYEAKI